MTERQMTCCGASHKHQPHDDCVGIPLPPIDPFAGPVTDGGEAGFCTCSGDVHLLSDHGGRGNNPRCDERFGK